MKSESNAASWLKFFSAAGIPRDEAENYAVTFSKNQIQLDMLPEIKKEYLKDMGITLMGHIIAILRHAKAVHADELKKTELTPSQKQSLLSGPKTKSTSKENKTSNKVEEEAHQKSATTLKRKSTIVQLKPAEEPKTKVKKKLCDSSDDVYVSANSSKSSIEASTRNINFDVTSDEYKKGVFKRLGDEVINTTSSISYPESSTSINGMSESVFARLGGKSLPQVTKEITTTSNEGSLKRLVASKGINNQSTSTKGIIRSRLDNKQQIPQTSRILVSPTYMDGAREERGSMISPTYMDRIGEERGIIVSPTYMDRVRDERDLHSRLNISPTSYCNPSFEKKDNIKARLGKSSLQLLSSGTRLLQRASGKKVSFGSVYQKLIPRERAPIRNRPLCLDVAIQRGSMGLSTGVFSRLGKNLH